MLAGQDGLVDDANTQIRSVGSMIMSEPVSESSATRSIWRAGYAKIEHLVHEAAKFGIVGLIALVFDIGLFNLLRFYGGEGPMYDKPITAKVISVAVATTVAYFGNRYWTFRDRGRTSFGREYVLFFVLNGVGMLIAITCLWVSHYLLKFTGPIADNISANVIGLGLGTIFRFWSYRKWVFPDDAQAAEDETIATIV